MSHYVKNGEMITVYGEGSVDLYSELPLGTYIVQRDPKFGFYLELVDDFNPIKKYYGHTEKYADRVIQTYLARGGSTGALFAGEKGSGKTLLSKLISYRCRTELKMPTIIVNTAFVNTEHDKTIVDNFLKLMQSIDTDAVILFDEFEKVYSKSEDQQTILTLLDGFFSTKKLFIFTCNDKYKIDSHIRNRPGRVYYMFEFQGLEEEFIADYCLDKLDDKTMTHRVVALSKLFSAFNFDMLQTVVEEANRFKEDPVNLIEFLNVKPGNDSTSNTMFEVAAVTVDGKELERKWLYTKWIHGNPLNKKSIELQLDEDSGVDDINLSTADIVKYSGSEGIIVLTRDKVTVVLREKKDAGFNYSKLLM